MEEVATNKAKGCKKFRMAMVGRRSLFYKQNDPRDIASGRTLLGNGIDEISRVRIHRIELWLMETNILESRFKEFVFRLMQGKLYVNQILANFADVRPQCTVGAQSIAHVRQNLVKCRRNISAHRRRRKLRFFLFKRSSAGE